MIDLADYARRIRRRSIAAATLFFGGAFLLVVDYTTAFPTAEKGEFAAIWFFLMGLGAYFYFRTMELPKNEVIHLAETRNGLLTVTEIAAAIHADPAVVLRTLVRLQTMDIARPCWHELDKNLWEFPDLTRLPVTQAVQIAHEKKGRITLHDLVAAGHSVEVAEQTFTLIAGKGIARETEDAGGPGLQFPEPPREGQRQ